MRKIFLICLVFLLCPMGHKARAYTQEDCVRCHQEGSRDSALHLSIEAFQASIHGREGISCQECHWAVEDEVHASKKGFGAVDCGECHDKENRHGLYTGSENRPECHACHTRHAILEQDDPSSSVHPQQLDETCRICHALQCGERDYLSWFPSLQIASHSKQDFSQRHERSNCIGCHQGMAAHGEEGQLNEQDCYICHLPKKGRAGLLGYIHPKADYKKQPSTFGAAVIYQVGIVCLIWGGFRYYIRKFAGKRQGTRR